MTGLTRAAGLHPGLPAADRRACPSVSPLSAGSGETRRPAHARAPRLGSDSDGPPRVSRRTREARGDPEARRRLSLSLSLCLSVSLSLSLSLSLTHTHTHTHTEAKRSCRRESLVVEGEKRTGVIRYKTPLLRPGTAVQEKGLLLDPESLFSLSESLVIRYKTPLLRPGTGGEPLSSCNG
jgi:hypothetical protein